MVELRPPDFVPVLQTMLYPANAINAGNSDYLDKKSKEGFRKRLINELMPRNGNLKRYEMWYLNYYLKPYMNRFSRSEFVRRWADVQDNLNTITENNQISPGDISKNDLWMVRFSELLAESQFRGGIPSNKVALDTIIKNISLKKFRHPQKSDRELPYYFKFGKKAHLRQMIEEDLVRLANSKTYRSNSMNHGQKDDENNFTFSIMPELLNGLDGQTGLVNLDPISRDSIVNITHQEPKDYLMWCASHRYDFRNPYAFNADALVIIKQPRTFKKNVSNAIKALGLYPTLGKVRYFDPYLDIDTKLDVRFSKHFRFSYQHEVRLVAQGKSLPNELFLSVPDLSTYCEIYDLI